jgi:hypothetical protein
VWGHNLKRACEVNINVIELKHRHTRLSLCRIPFYWSAMCQVLSLAAQHQLCFHPRCKCRVNWNLYGTGVYGDLRHCHASRASFDQRHDVTESLAHKRAFPQPRVAHIPITMATQRTTASPPLTVQLKERAIEFVQHCGEAVTSFAWLWPVRGILFAVTSASVFPHPFQA